MTNELTTKIQNAVLDMITKIGYDKKHHTYTNYETKEWLQGVSTISSIVPKDWLPAWGAKEAVKALGYSDYEGDIEKAKEILIKISQLKDDPDILDKDKKVIKKGITKEEKWILFLKEAKGASARKNKESLVDGKAGHDWLEFYIKAKIRGEELPKISEGNLERPIKQFLKWEEKEVDYWILSEARVAYPEKKYAGTLDAMAMMKTGKLALIDFKFASHISEDYYLQTAGYQATFEPYDVKVDNRIIIRLPKTLMKEEWDKKEYKYKMVENNIEVKVVDTSYELDRDTFFYCVFIKKWINLMTNNYGK